MLAQSVKPAITKKENVLTFKTIYSIHSLNTVYKVTHKVWDFNLTWTSKYEDPKMY